MYGNSDALKLGGGGPTCEDWLHYCNLWVANGWAGHLEWDTPCLWEAQLGDVYERLTRLTWSGVLASPGGGGG